MNILFDDAAEIHKSKIQVATPEEVREDFLLVFKINTSFFLSAGLYRNSV